MTAGDDLRAFFHPDGVAVIGASCNPRKAGYHILRNMLQGGFSGGLYPVNPQGGTILGLESCRSLEAVPGRVDLAVLAVSSESVESVVKDLRARQARAGDVKALAVVAAGFAETGTREGVLRQRLLLDACRETGIRVLGPNCVGVVNSAHALDTTFIMGGKRRTGGISFVSQSGAVGAWLMESWVSGSFPVGFGKFASVGNMADVDLIELLEYLGDDDSTSVVGLYLEGFARGRLLAETVGRLVMRKPLVVLKVGRSSLGAEAAHSHTGSMAGPDRIYDGVLSQVGARRVSSVEELSDTLRAFDRLPLPSGPGTFLVTQAGGPGIYCADVLADMPGVELACVSDETKRVLRQGVPPFASVCQPEGHADITAAATSDQHSRALEAVLRDDSVHAVVLITVPVPFMPPDEVARALAASFEKLAKEGVRKPVFPVLLAGDAVADGRRLLEESGVPTFETPDRAARALAHMIAYARHRIQACAGKMPGKEP